MTMMDYCPRPSASGNSPPWSSEAPRGNGFDYSPNSHETTVLLPNNNISARCRIFDSSDSPHLGLLAYLKDTMPLMRRLTICF